MASMVAVRSVSAKPKQPGYRNKPQAVLDKLKVTRLLGLGILCRLSRCEFVQGREVVDFAAHVKQFRNRP